MSPLSWGHYKCMIVKKLDAFRRSKNTVPIVCEGCKLLKLEDCIYIPHERRKNGDIIRVVHCGDLTGRWPGENLLRTISKLVKSAVFAFPSPAQYHSYCAIWPK